MKQKQRRRNNGKRVKNKELTESQKECKKEEKDKSKRETEKEKQKRVRPKKVQGERKRNPGNRSPFGGKEEQGFFRLTAKKGKAPQQNQNQKKQIRRVADTPIFILF